MSINAEGGRDVTERIVERESISRRFGVTQGPVLATASSPDCRRLEIGSFEDVKVPTAGELRILEFPSLEPLLMLDEFTNQEGVIALTFSPDGRKLASAHLGGRIRIFDSRPWN